MTLSYFSFVSCKAFLISLKEFDFPYIKTPPLYTLAPNIARITIDAIKIAIPSIGSHTGS